MLIVHKDLYTIAQTKVTIELPKSIGSGRKLERSEASMFGEEGGGGSRDDIQRHRSLESWDDDDLDGTGNATEAYTGGHGHANNLIAADEIESNSHHTRTPDDDDDGHGNEDDYSGKPNAHDTSDLDACGDYRVSSSRELRPSEVCAKYMDANPRSWP